uniref:Uncharacterized protein n=1 Tax=uncultured prokaryote TaxID=198431 RepID=A0A0H5PZ97_9ZZZZ|nr:hypothetical protein [uncultured prokaryote]
MDQISGQFLQHSRLHSHRLIGVHDTVSLTSIFTKVTDAGSMVYFPIHKGYYGEPYTIQGYQACIAH